MIPVKVNSPEEIVRQRPKNLPMPRPADVVVPLGPREIKNLSVAFETKVGLGPSSTESIFRSWAENLNTVYRSSPVQAVEEHFDGTIEEVTEEGLRLSTVSSGGEEAEAWLPWTAFDEDPGEKKFVQVGAPIRITIFSDRTLVRVLRPAQWKIATEASDAVTDMLLNRMKQVLDQG
jgi:hypothetical protein